MGVEFIRFSSDFHTNANDDCLEVKFSISKNNLTPLLTLTALEAANSY